MTRSHSNHPPRLSIVASHPIQYHAPLFRTLARQLELTVFYAHNATATDQANAGFDVEFDWDVDLLSGYESCFLNNASNRPGLNHFTACDSPEIGVRLREGGFDAVLLMGWHLKTFFQAGLAAKRLGLPLLVRGDSHLHTPRSLGKRVVKAAGYPLFLRSFDAALYVGRHSREYWHHYRYPERRLFFSPHSVDTHWFAERATQGAGIELRARLGISNDATVVLFVGKLVPFKRPLDLVMAAALLRRRGEDVAVLVAGSGPLEDEMAATARSAGVSFYPLGFCNQSQMPAVYAAADVLVLPSDARETWGLVANEALACARPIVLSDAVGSAPDLVGDGTAGQMYRAGNSVALAEALGRLLRNPPTVQAIDAKSKSYGLDVSAAGVVAAIRYVGDHSRWKRTAERRIDV